MKHWLGVCDTFLAARVSQATKYEGRRGYKDLKRVWYTALKVQGVVAENTGWKNRISAEQDLVLG